MRVPATKHLIFAAVVLVSIASAACKKDVEQEKVDAVTAWSKAVCKCVDEDDAKKCVKKLETPPPSHKLASGNVNDTYRAASVEAYEKIYYVGQRCQDQVLKSDGDSDDESEGKSKSKSKAKDEDE